MNELTRAQQVNRKTAELEVYDITRLLGKENIAIWLLLGGNIEKSFGLYRFQSPDGKRVYTEHDKPEWAWHTIRDAAHRPIPDYRHSLDAAVAAANEQLKGVAVNKIDNIWSVSWADKTGEWHVMPVMIDATLQAIAAAICEAILQAHGVTVASEPESEVGE